MIVAEAEEADGELVKELVVVTATVEVVDIGGIPCRVIRGLGDEADTVYCGEH